MSITDELREYAGVMEHMTVNNFDPVHGASFILSLADHIDAEHEAMLADARKAVYQDYVALPKDVDGQPIRIGDVMENTVCPSVHREVTGVGVECFYGWDKGNGRYSQFSANRYRHHHAQTVEDVLREFANEVYADADNEIRDRDFLCAKYAKRLALAGDAE